MARFCEVCGRPLRKTQGQIGPVCWRRMHGTGRKRTRISSTLYVKYMSAHDLFADEETKSGSETNATTSTNNQE